MLYRVIIAVCSQIHTKHIKTLCGQNIQLLNVKLLLHHLTSRIWKVSVTHKRNWVSFFDFSYSLHVSALLCHLPSVYTLMEVPCIWVMVPFSLQRKLTIKPISSTFNCHYKTIIYRIALNCLSQNCCYSSGSTLTMFEIGLMLLPINIGTPETRHIYRLLFLSL